MRPVSSSISPRSLESRTVSRRSFVAATALAAAGALSLRRTMRGAEPDAPVPEPLPENVSLRDLMTPEEFKAAGLKKLSPEELMNLERFLKGYRDQTVQTVAKQTEERVSPPPKRNRAAVGHTVESHINGSFEGLTGRTRMILDDGSIWQQANDTDKVKVHLEHPEVILVRSIFGYRMFIVGLTRPFYVKQIILD